tara:strand:+ start:117 stop:668 length:552 start_codon:yes stop_codon:yes gene_type:complete
MKSLKDIKVVEEEELIEAKTSKTFSNLRKNNQSEIEEVAKAKPEREQEIIDQHPIDFIDGTQGDDKPLDDQRNKPKKKKKKKNVMSDDNGPTPKLETVSKKVEDVYSLIVESVEKNRDKKLYFESDDSSFVIDPKVSKIIKTVYESLNRDNRRIMREKLNENLSSFCKVLSFSICKLGKVEES